jgi:hypothetical protein
VVNHRAHIVALRALLRTLSVCTTGSTTLSATATGYARAAGSFLTDGFAAGMEVTPTGFTQTTRSVITGVSALAITVAGGRTVEGAAAGRTLAVALPATRAWENTGTTAARGSVYVEEEYLPGAADLTTLGTNGVIVVEPMYVVTFAGPSEAGPLALTAYADAVLALFAPKTELVLSTGDVLRVHGDPAPYRDQLTDGDPGWAVVSVTIPLWLQTTNTI